MKQLLNNWKNQPGIFLNEHSETITYQQLAGRIENEINLLRSKFPIGTSFAIEAENNLETFVKFLSLLIANYPVILCPSYQFKNQDYRKFLEEETEIGFHFCSKKQSLVDLSLRTNIGLHKQIRKAVEDGLSPFIVRTSGSSKKKFKFILHSANNFLLKYQKIGSHFEKTIAFSPAESIAGIETLLEVVTHTKSLVAAGDRLSPVLVNDLIQQHSVDYFQTTPTFLNLMVLSRKIQPGSMPSLKKIAYGSEPAVASVVEAIQKNLNVEMKHTYGMSEIGIQVTKTPQSNATYFFLDEEFNPGRVINQHLEVKSLTRMICYLNFESNNSEWFATGDIVSEKDGFFKVLGRQDDLINMAGRKFFPSELEEIIACMPSVLDVIVSKEVNELIGAAINAKIIIDPSIDEADFRIRFKKYCEESIPFFMHPHRVSITHQMPDQPRFKKLR